MWVCVREPFSLSLSMTPRWKWTNTFTTFTFCCGSREPSRTFYFKAPIHIYLWRYNVCLYVWVICLCDTELVKWKWPGWAFIWTREHSVVTHLPTWHILYKIEIRYMLKFFFHIKKNIIFNSSNFLFEFRCSNRVKNIIYL